MCRVSRQCMVVGGFAFIVGAIACAAGGYILNRKAINLAFLSIGVDYFRCSACSEGLKREWPAELKTIYKLLSVFNFNIGEFVALLWLFILFAVSKRTMGRTLFCLTICLCVCVT